MSIAIAAVVLAGMVAASAADQAGTTKAPTKQGTTTSKAAPKKGAPAAKAGPSKAALMNPAALKAVAPPTYNAVFSTSLGDFVVLVHRDWAPVGADRFYNLVKNGYYNENRFFRVIPNFMVQFGINGDPSIQKNWREANIAPDPVKQSNKRGYISFAMRGSGPDTRTTQVFINFKDNTPLDGMGFAPFGEVVSGMEIVDKINPEHRETPDQMRIQAEGNKYLMAEFPKLDYVKTATISTTPAAAPKK
jgi:peptidyl-prolyl cis-trans isomerase A (cyclophilin A)